MSGERGELKVCMCFSLFHKYDRGERGVVYANQDVVVTEFSETVQENSSEG